MHSVVFFMHFLRTIIKVLLQIIFNESNSWHEIIHKVVCKMVQKWLKSGPKVILRASIKAEIVLNNLYFISKLLVQSSFMEFKEFGKCKQGAYLVFFLILS